MASLPWSPWPLTNRTEMLSPAQIERILQMHKESKQNAVIYVLVVLAVYLVALAILVGRYLHHERDHDTILCISQALERCVGSCRRDGLHHANNANSCADPGKDGAPRPSAATAGLAPAAGAPRGPRVGGGHPGIGRKVSLRLPPPSQPPPPLSLPRIKRPPQSDDSSDCSSSPSCGGSGRSNSGGSDSSSAPQCESTSMDTMTMEVRGGCCDEGHISPAVVSVMVCDLQDTQV